MTPRAGRHEPSIALMSAVPTWIRSAREREHDPDATAVRRGIGALLLSPESGSAASASRRRQHPAGRANISLVEGLGSAVALLIFAASLIAYIILWVRTWLDIQRSGLDPTSRGMWSLAILVFQVFGPIAWWWAGPGARHRV